ncbi:MAG: hypothetical protein AB7G40_03375 [Hyphomonadaceae bacterium]
MIRALLLVLLAAPLLTACVVGTVVGATGAVIGAAVGTTGAVIGTTVDVLTPDGDDDDDDDDDR